MALKAVVARRFLDEILGSMYKEGSWKVLVLDHLSTRIMSACCKMQDIMSKGITIVEALEKNRQPLPHLEAIYIVAPTDKTIAAMINDFSGQPQYKAAHIYFLEKCSSSLFSKLGAGRITKRILTLQEANMAFLPYESHVFTLDYPQAFSDLYTPGSVGKQDMLDRISAQVATVCAMLGEYPSVRFRSDMNHVADIAEAIQLKLDSYKADKRDLGSGMDKSKSQLIILDRGFDVQTPILHELTFQAMVYDVLNIKNDVYTYRAAAGDQGSKQRDVILDENDELWCQLRHQHIADVSKVVYEQFQSFATKKKLKHAGDPDVSIKDLARHLRRVPQYQKELGHYSLHINLVDECLKRYRGGLNALCKVEQNLVLGTDGHGEPIADPLKEMTPCLFDRNIKVYDKIRLLMMYILYKKGVSKEDFLKLVQHSEIPHNERKVILNLMHLGYTILTEETVKGPKHKLKPKDRPEEKYEVSRWTPLVQDIADYASEGTLNEAYCPYLRGKARAPSTSAGGGGAATTPTTAGAGTSVRQRWNWIPSQRTESKSEAQAAAKKSGPTIIIFIVGGMTYSEMRAAYEASRGSSYEVIIGSTNILTPGEFLGQLKDLKPLVAT